MLVLGSNFLEAVEGFHDQGEPQLGFCGKEVGGDLRVELNGLRKFGVISHHVDVQCDVDVEIADVRGEDATEGVLVEFGMAASVKEVEAMALHVRLAEVYGYHFVILGVHVLLGAGDIGDVVMGQIKEVLNGLVKCQSSLGSADGIEGDVGVNARGLDGLPSLRLRALLHFVVVHGKLEGGVSH